VLSQTTLAELVADHALVSSFAPLPVLPDRGRRGAVQEVAHV
jgi:hypothetical protein